MTISTILAAGLTAGTSTDFTVAQGASVNIGVFSSTAGAIPSAYFDILQVTPGVPNVIGSVGPSRAVNIAGPGTYRVSRPALTGTAFGVFLEV